MCIYRCLPWNLECCFFRCHLWVSCTFQIYKPLNWSDPSGLPPRRSLFAARHLRQPTPQPKASTKVLKLLRFIDGQTYCSSSSWYREMFDIMYWLHYDFNLLNYFELLSTVRKKYIPSYYRKHYVQWCRCPCFFQYPLGDAVLMVSITWLQNGVQ